MPRLLTVKEYVSPTNGVGWLISSWEKSEVSGDKRAESNRPCQPVAGCLFESYYELQDGNSTAINQVQETSSSPGYKPPTLPHLAGWPTTHLSLYPTKLVTLTSLSSFPRSLGIQAPWPADLRGGEARRGSRQDLKCPHASSLSPSSS